jgi:hypothetical protein
MRVPHVPNWASSLSLASTYMISVVRGAWCVVRGAWWVVAAAAAAGKQPTGTTAQ